MSRGSFGSLLRQMARESARRQRMAEAEHRRHIRDQIQAERLAERSRVLETKEAKQRYVEEQTDKAKEMTDETKGKIDEMRALLLHTLSINDTIGFDSLRVPEPFPPFSPKPGLLTPLSPPEKSRFMQRINRPSLFKRMIPVFRKQYLGAIQQADAEYKKALEAHEKLEATRRATLDELRQKHEKDRADHEIKSQQRLKEIDEFESCYKQNDPKAVVDYTSMVLERSEYPEGFPQEFRVAYVPESKQLVIDYELPNPDIIPKVADFRYVKSKDTIEERPRKDSEVKEVYQDIVASVALRTCHEIFEADQGSHVSVIVFNGFIQTIDPSTGKDIRPYLISLRTTKERFLEIDLSRIDKKACLRNLGAQVSPRPYEVQPIKPIIEFDMVDKRFVEQSDILSDLESRPNLMDLNPFEFENLVSNLFGCSGTSVGNHKM